MDIKIFSKILFLVCLFYISCNGLQAQSAIPPFRKGERVVFTGNSITHGGHYHSFIWLYYMTRFPDKVYGILKIGWIMMFLTENRLM